MLRTMLKSKIHRATLTGTELHYEGSITVDVACSKERGFCRASRCVLNVNTGARLITYHHGPARFRHRCSAACGRLAWRATV